MSATTLSTRTLPGPVASTASWFLVSALHLARWFWGIAVVVAAIAVTAYVSVADTVETSALQYGVQAVVWVPMSVFIGLSLSYLPAHVASGLTRRSLSRGALIAAVATGLGYGAAFALLLLAERSVYGAVGGQWSVGADGATTAAFLVACTVTFVAADIAGLLVGTVYLRGGGWWGTLTLPVTVGPVVALMVAAPLCDEQGLALASAAGLAFTVVIAVVYDRLVRGAAVPPKR